MQNLRKPRSAKIEQMLTTLCKQCSSIIPVDIPSCCLWTGTICPKRSACFPREAPDHVTALPLSATPPPSTCILPPSPLRRTIWLLFKWWQSTQVFLFPNTHRGDLSACRGSSLRSHMAGELEGLSPCLRAASPPRRQHVTATPLHTQPANPSALSAASLYMLQ